MSGRSSDISGHCQALRLVRVLTFFIVVKHCLQSSNGAQAVAVPWTEGVLSEAVWREPSVSPLVSLHGGYLRRNAGVGLWKLGGGSAKGLAGRHSKTPALRILLCWMLMFQLAGNSFQDLRIWKTARRWIHSPTSTTRRPSNSHYTVTSCVLFYCQFCLLLSVFL